MPGLVNTQIDSTKDAKLPDDPNQVKTVTATSYDPTMRAVDANQTVAGQLDKVLGSDSPLIAKARAEASEQANARGLQNSSMAVGAGESAAISAALPIAQQDASTYGQAASQNQEASNTAGQFGATATNQQADISAGAVNTGQTIRQQEQASSTLSAQQAEQSSTLSAQQAAQQQAQTKLQGEVETGLQTLRGTQSVDLANIEASYKQLMQANSSAASIYNESLQQISTILRDPNTSPEQKQSAVSGVISLLSSGLNVVGSISNLDLGSLLDFSGVTNAATPSAPAPAQVPGQNQDSNFRDITDA